MTKDTQNANNLLNVWLGLLSALVSEKQSINKSNKNIFPTDTTVDMTTLKNYWKSNSNMKNILQCKGIEKSTTCWLTL